MRISPLAHQIGRLVVGSRLINPKDRVLVAVSGGSDSVALLSLFAEIQTLKSFHLAAVYVDHGWQSVAQRKKNKQWIKRLGVKLNVSVYLASATTAAKKKKRTGWEATARLARYQALERLAKRKRFNVVAVGHTLDDQAETLLLMLCRGSGLRGAGGMKVSRLLGKTKIRLIRPLLKVRRAQLRSYLKQKKITWLEDPSNREDKFLRNRIRKRVMPRLIREFGPQLVDRLGTFSALAQEDEQILELQVETWRRQHLTKRGSRVRFKQAALLNEPVALQRRLVRHAIEIAAGSLKRMTFQHVDQSLKLLKKKQGESHLPLGVLVEVNQGVVRICKNGR